MGLKLPKRRSCLDMPRTGWSIIEMVANFDWVGLGRSLRAPQLLALRVPKRAAELPPPPPALMYTMAQSERTSIRVEETRRESSLMKRVARWKPLVDDVTAAGCFGGSEPRLISAVFAPDAVCAWKRKSGEVFGSVPVYAKARAVLAVETPQAQKKVTAPPLSIDAPLARGKKRALAHFGAAHALAQTTAPPVVERDAPHVDT